MHLPQPCTLSIALLSASSTLLQAAAALPVASTSPYSSLGPDAVDGLIMDTPPPSQQYHIDPDPAPVPQTRLDVDGYPPAPPGLALAQVHVYVRHGERTPVGVRLNTGPAPVPEHWMLCNAAHAFRGAVADLLPPAAADEDAPFRKVVERKDGTPADGQCLLGELTDVGRESTYAYGRALRALYIDRLAFLPPTLPAADASALVYFRSTHAPRTLASLQHIMRGMYPPATWAGGKGPVLRVRNAKDETLSGNALACPKLRSLLYSFAQAAAAAHNTTLAPLDATLSKYLNGAPLRVDGSPRASGVMDTVRAARAHGIAVPPPLSDARVVRVIEAAVVAEWFGGYRTEGVRRLGMGPLLGELGAKLAAMAGEGRGARLLVHSGHDAGLAALLATLDVFDDAWPEFTASITFELFSRTDAAPQRGPVLQRVMATLGRSAPADHYVRMRYQNKNMVLPLCAGAGDHLPGHPEFCTLAKFRARVAELAPSDWQGECAVVDSP
ncbi:hypothetical protein HWV62_9379 [Athelia sp. TMB]|nr:hypothetical protein HWV62_9379 [Athelia sp. TMB]